jgi:hypothetical protein
MVLGEDTEPKPLRHRDKAVALLLLAGDDPKKGALARAVGTHQPVAAAGIELKVDGCKENLTAVRLGEIGDRDHSEEG